MKAWTFFSRLLSIVLVAGLLTAPVSAAQGVGSATNNSMNAMQGMVMGDMASMENMMPLGKDCCQVPEKQLPDCQKSCPMVMGCLMKCFPSTSSVSGFHFIISTTMTIAALFDDEAVRRLPGPLPYEPPRS